MNTHKKIFFIISLLMMNFMFASQIDKNRVVELPVSGDPTISFRIMFYAGSQYDPAGKEGLSYLTTQLLSEGSTTENSLDNILKKLFPLAASISVQSGREITALNGRIHKDNLSQYFPLFTGQILKPAFKEDEFNRIKAETLSYLTTALKYSSDEELGKAALYNTIYAGSPYAHPDQGTIEGVKSITLEDVRGFYNKFYNRNNFVIGIGGGYGAECLEDLWSNLQKLSEGSRAVPPEIKVPEIKGLNVVIVEKSAKATAISIGAPIDLVRGSKDWYALAVANSWLGEHRNSSSHLYNVIREQRGLNYGDYSYIENYPNGGRLQLPAVNVPRRFHLFEIWIRPVPNETAHFALRAALRELQRLIDKGLTEEQFNLTKNFLSKYILHYAPTTNKRLGYALDDKFYGLNPGHLEKYSKALSELTLQDVNTAIKKYLQYKNLVIAFITQNSENLKKNLVENLPSPIKYSTPKDDSVMKEDIEIQNYPLTISADNLKIIPLDKVFIR